jgi:hypothetical protein
MCSPSRDRARIKQNIIYPRIPLIMSKAISKEDIVRAAMQSVVESTRKQYSSMVKKIAGPKDANGKRSISLHGLMVFLLQPTTRIGHATADRYLTAVKFFYHARGREPDPGTLAQCEQVIRTYKKTHPAKVKVDKGPVDRPRFMQVLSYIDKHDAFAVLRDPVVMQWSFGLRGGQLKQIAPTHFHTLANGEYLYSGPRHKVKAAAAKEFEEQEDHWADPHMKAEITAVLDKFRNSDKKAAMFPKHKVTEVTKLLKAVAERYKWPADLKWNGSHNLRHGTLAEARAQGGLEEVARRGAHQSKAMQEYYSRPDEARAKRRDRDDNVVATTARAAPARKTPQAAAAAKR